MTIMMVPLESWTVIAVAFALCGALFWILSHFKNKFWPSLKKISEITFEVPLFKVKIKASGAIVLFCGFFILIVVLYAALRVVPVT